MHATLTVRLSRYLLARLRRRAIHEVYERAAEVGVLEAAFIDRRAEAGLVWKLPSPSPLSLSGNDDTDRIRILRLLRRAIPTLPETSAGAPVETMIISDDGDWTNVRSLPKRRREREEEAALGGKTSAPALDTERDGEGRSSADRDRVLRLIRSCVTPPGPADAAVVLALARAVADSVGGLDALLAVLRQPDPMVIVAVPLSGFEDRFGKLLEEGYIVPRSIAQADGFDQYALSGRYKAVPDGQPRLITFGGLSIRQKSDRLVVHNLAKARSRADTPIVIADEGISNLPMQVTVVADLIIRLAHVDRALIAELLQVVAGIAPKAAFAAMKRVGLDPRGIGLDDIVLAVRPGRPVDRIVEIMKTLGKGGDRDSDDDESNTGNGKSKDKSGKAKSTASGGKAEVRFDITQPAHGAPPSDRGDQPMITQHSAFKVETLAGYGEAKQWALDLKTDLALWRDRQIAWPELSSRLLLSGPPGTGKTTFAKALCNSLEVPMLSTSVAHWLEPGYLGDVLKTMSAAFETARSHAPCILFIDELDNIGRRGGGGQHSDYWDSLINRLLELLDGASRLDGVVVVGATNYPDRIDAALLRSGRLEKHVVIAPPNIDALVGIIKHHLGNDLEIVLANRPRPGIDHASPHAESSTDGSEIDAPAKSGQITDTGPTEVLHERPQQ